MPRWRRAPSRCASVGVGVSKFSRNPDRVLLSMIKTSLGGSQPLPQLRDSAANRVERSQIATLLWCSYFAFGVLFGGAAAVVNDLLGGWWALPLVVVGCAALGRAGAVGVSGQQLQRGDEPYSVRIQDRLALMLGTVFFAAFVLIAVG